MKRPITYHILPFICLLFCCSGQIAFGQDTLSYNLTQADSSEVIKMIDEAMNSSDDVDARLLLEQALDNSKEIRYTQGIRKSLDLLSNLETQKGNLTKGLRYALELASRLEKDGELKLLFNTYMWIAEIYQRENLSAKSLDYLLLAKQTPDILLSDNESYDLKFQIGYAYFNANNSDSALVYFNQLLDYHKADGDPIGQINIYQYIINVFNRAKDYQTALFYNFESEPLLVAHGKRKDLAVLYNNIGYNYSYLKDYPNAIKYFEKTLEYVKGGSPLSVNNINVNLAIAYNNIGDTQKALEQLQEAEFRTDEKDKETLSYLDHLIATVQLNNGDLYNALQYNEKAIETSKENGFNRTLIDAYNTGALIFQEFYEYEKALEYFKMHLLLKDSIVLEERIRQEALLQQQFTLESSEKEIKLLLINQDMKDLAIQQLVLEKEKLRLVSDKLELEARTKQDELALLKRNQEVKEANLKNKELEAQRAQQALALAQQSLAAAKKDKEISDLNERERRQQEEIEKTKAEEEKQKAAKELLEKENAIQNLELEQERSFRNLAYWIGGLLFWILLLILAGLYFVRKANKRLGIQNKKIESQKSEIEKSRDAAEKEREKSDALLLNILPEETATELKEQGFATPRKYDQVSVLFTDFENFTNISSSFTPDELIAELNTCFKVFDEIAETHGLEKIKTIGDSYMCAGGVPTPNENNAEQVVQAAIKMRDFMLERRKHLNKTNKKYWGMRIGIHTGPVIAGVVGRKKFAYDMWGNTVNMASRMESSGTSGKVNISADTYHLVKHKFTCTPRGKIEVKNKGPVDMYYAEETT